MRLFLAIELDRSIKKALGKWIDALAPFRKDVRWVQPDRMHLTVKFIGNLPDDRVADVCDTSRELATTTLPTSLSLDRCGVFPQRGPVRVIWGGPEKTPAALSDLASRCEDAFESLAIARERRPFNAHMTIGRVRDDRSGPRLRDAVNALKIDPIAQAVDSLTVYQSELGPHGATYTALGRFPFGGAAPSPKPPTVEIEQNE